MREDMEAIRVMGFWYWLFCRTGAYRLVMRVAHRYHWHYAPMHGPLQDGSTQRWCEWCGFRQTYPVAAGLRLCDVGVSDAGRSSGR